MFGWIMIFALMVLSGTLFSMGTGVGLAFGMTSSIVFGFLLLLSALTLILRRRT